MLLCCWCSARHLQKEDYETGKPPKGSIDLLQVPTDESGEGAGDEAAFLSGAEQNEIHLLIRGTSGTEGADKNKNKNQNQKKEKEKEYQKAKAKATKDRVFVLQAPDYETAASWLVIVKEWVIYLH